MYKQILSEGISKSFNGTWFRGARGEDHTLSPISNSPIVRILLTLTDNGECVSPVSTEHDLAHY